VKGILALLVLYGVSIGVTGGIMAVYWWEDERIKEREEQGRNEEREGEEEEENKDRRIKAQL
jgi:H+/gluconate symporter-like permease